MAVKKNIPPKIQTQGVGPSKVFGGRTEQEFPDGKSARCTVNGEPLPEEFWHTFPFSLTDQGKAEAEQLRKALPVSYKTRDGNPNDYSNVSDDDKKIEKFGDGLRSELISPQSAMAQMMAKHTPPGHRGLWMGHIKTEREGMLRDQIEYQPVMIRDDEGKMVRVRMGNMFLASVPERTAQAQERLNVDRARAAEVHSQEKVLEQSDRIIAQSDMQEIAKRRRTLEDLGGSRYEDESVAMGEILAHESA